MRHGHLTRRRFIASATSAGLYMKTGHWRFRAFGPDEDAARTLHEGAFPVQFRKPLPYESLAPYIHPGSDDFPAEKEAAEICSHLSRLAETRTLPLSPDFQGHSPVPKRYRKITEGVHRGDFDGSEMSDAERYQSEILKWLDLFGQVRSARFFVLPEGLVRYEISSEDSSGLHYRVGQWRQAWVNGRLLRSECLREPRTTAARPLFRDVTSSLFGNVESFTRQLLKGVPYWRACLDSASGIDI